MLTRDEKNTIIASISGTPATALIAMLDTLANVQKNTGTQNWIRKQVKAELARRSFPALKREVEAVMAQADAILRSF